MLLVREQAGKRLSQVSDGLRLGFVLVAGTEGLAKGVEGIGQGLGFAAKQRTKQEARLDHLRDHLGSYNTGVRC